MTRIADLVGVRVSGPAACWRLVRSAMDLLGHPPWEPETAVQQWHDGDDVTREFANVPRFWEPVDPAHAVLGDLLVIRDGQLPSHCGIVAEDGLVLHHDRAMGARTVELRRLLRCEMVASAWRFGG